MITELMTFRGFPHWLTRKDQKNETILTMDNDKEISIGDGFSFGLKPVNHDEESAPLMESINFFKVIEIVEKRKSKGLYSTVSTPDHYVLRCVPVTEVVDFNKIAFSTGYSNK